MPVAANAECEGGKDFMPAVSICGSGTVHVVTEIKTAGAHV